MTLGTSISLPVVRHPVVLAKWLTTLGCLTGGSDRRWARPWLFGR
jgi:alkanesulfonate monooxygenase SsuD/methylene tetrahydromethanopterin reductase-like flavin-dependent oxidoreductase (luciferase family)